MDVTAINLGTSPLLDAAAAASTLPAAQNREVIQAVKALNGADLFGQDNELVFQRDAAARRIVIRVVDRKTKEVISQIPPEYVLRLAEELRAEKG